MREKLSIIHRSLIIKKEVAFSSCSIITWLFLSIRSGVKRLKSKEINRHFQQLKKQREIFYNDCSLDFKHAWRRPLPDKWFIGETLYHLVLLVRLFRRFSVLYIPVMLPIAHLRKKKPYQSEIHNIYKEYKEKKKRSMSAPSLLVPPKDLKKDYRFKDVQELLEEETKKLMDVIESMEENVAGHIRYPDPIAYYPNLIQSIHLLAIHEQHHFDLVKKYELLQLQ